MTLLKPDLQVVERENGLLARGGHRRMARIAVPMAGTEWQLREAPGIRVKPSACEITGTLGHEPFRLLVEPSLVDACLGLAPDPVPPSDISPPDAALLCEHVMSSAITQLELALGRPIALLSIQSVTQASASPGMGFEMNAGHGWAAAQLFIEDRAVMLSVGEALDRLEAMGPRGLPGLPAMVGPIYLPRDEAPLAAGEQLMLLEGPASALSGVVFLDFHLEWSVTLMKDQFEVLGPLRETQADPRDSRQTLYLEWGRTLSHAAMRVGEKLPYASPPSDLLSLMENNAVIARCRLVTLGQGLALEIVETERAG